MGKFEWDEEVWMGRGGLDGMSRFGTGGNRMKRFGWDGEVWGGMRKFGWDEEVLEGIGRFRTG